MGNRVFLVALGIFLSLYGLFAVTNITVAWGPTLLGFAALVAGVVCLFLLFTRQPPWNA